MSNQESQDPILADCPLDWEQKWQEEIGQGAALAMWRLPHSQQRYFLVDQSGGKPVSSLDLTTYEPGFLIAPFTGTPLFLNADEMYVSDVPRKQVEAFDIVEYATNSIQREDFLYWVNASVNEIKQGKFQKVVLSRTDKTTLAPSFSILHSFESLCEVYQNAFVCAVYIPEGQQTWLCASPEILVSKDANGIFKTISLAGTQSALNVKGDIISTQEARWSQKEIEEQAFVSRYIIECFKKIRLREYIENGPKTIQAGNLLHLKTEYIVDTLALNFPTLPGIMLSLLHPTSAVCGTPKDQAIEWIKKAEKHAREFYSGYLGPVNLHDALHLFVNLRTVKIEKSKLTEGFDATYFAGCGITEDSDPEMEWLETQMKCQTLQRILTFNA